MNDDLMFDYLLQMGQMQPEQLELKRKQAMVDALRKSSLTPMEGQMIGKHYVAPGLAGAVSQLGQAYFAAKGQQGVDDKLAGMTSKQTALLREKQMELERRRREQLGNAPGGSQFGMDLIDR